MTHDFKVGGCLQQKEKIPAETATFSGPEKVKTSKPFGLMRSLRLISKCQLMLEVSCWSVDMEPPRKSLYFCHRSENFPTCMSEIWGSSEFMARLAFYSHFFYLILLILVCGQNPVARGPLQASNTLVMNFTFFTFPVLPLNCYFLVNLVVFWGQRISTNFCNFLRKQVHHRRSE